MDSELGQWCKRCVHSFDWTFARLDTRSARQEREDGRGEIRLITVINLCPIRPRPSASCGTLLMVKKKNLSRPTEWAGKEQKEREKERKRQAPSLAVQDPSHHLPSPSMSTIDHPPSTTRHTPSHSTIHHSPFSITDHTFDFTFLLYIPGHPLWSLLPWSWECSPWSFIFLFSLSLSIPPKRPLEGAVLQCNTQRGIWERDTFCATCVLSMCVCVCVYVCVCVCVGPSLANLCLEVSKRRRQFSLSPSFWLSYWHHLIPKCPFNYVLTVSIYGR